MNTYICPLCTFFNTECSSTHSFFETLEIPKDVINKTWNFTNKGGTISEEHKKAISNYRKGKPTTKGKHNHYASANGKKGSAKLSKTATGRRKFYLPDGTWTWAYPNNG